MFAGSRFAIGVCHVAPSISTVSTMKNVLVDELGLNFGLVHADVGSSITQKRRPHASITSEVGDH